MFCPGISNDSNNNKKSFFFLFFFRICICVCAVHRQKMWLKCLLTYQAPYCMNRYTIILKLKWTAKWRVMRSHCKIYFFFFDTIVSTYLFSFFKKCLQIYIAVMLVGLASLRRIFFFSIIFCPHFIVSVFTLSLIFFFCFFSLWTTRERRCTWTGWLSED